MVVLGFLALPLVLTATRVDVAIITALVVVGAIASLRYALRLKGYLSERSALVERLSRTTMEVVDDVDVEIAWIEQVKSDDYARAHLIERLLAKRELTELQHRIDDGERALAQLLPGDPLQTTLQVELETLRSRRERISAGCQEHADGIDAAVERNRAENKRQAADKEKRLAEAERQREYEEKLRACAIDDEE